MAETLPPVEQIFTIAASEFLAGINEMAAATDRLAESITLAAESAARLDGAEAGTAAASDEAAVALDAQAAAAERAGAASEGAGAKTAGFGKSSKLAFLAVAAAVAYSVDKAAKFQAEMTKLNTQAGVAKNQLKSLGDGVLQLAGQVGESPDSLAMSLYHVESNFASLGIKGPKALSLVKIAAEGARVGGANLVDVTNALTAAVASGIPGVQNFSQAMGVLNATVGSGDMTMQDLAEAFGTGMVAVVKGYGLSIKDVGAALATFGDNNIRGAKAGTDLRMAVQALAVPAKAGAAQLQALGMNSGTLARDMQSGGLLKALDDLSTRFRKAGISAKTEGEVITTMFGKKAGVGVALLMEQMDRLRSKYPAITKAADTFGSSWATTQKTVGQQFADLKGNLDSLAIRFGQVLLPPVLKVTTAVNHFMSFIQKHQEVAAFAGALVGVAVAAKMMSGVEAVMSGVAAGVAMIGKAAAADVPEVTALDAAMDANVFAIVLIAIVALVAGFYELYKHSKLVRDIVADVGKFFKAAWKEAMEAAGAVVKWFVNGPLAFIRQQIAAFSKWWQQNHKEIEQVAKVVWTAIKAYITIAWAIIHAYINVGLTVLKALWITTWDLVRDVVKTVWNVMAAAIRIALNLIRDIIAVVLDVITGHWSKAWNDLKRLASDAIHGVLSIVHALLSGFVTTMFDLGKNLIEGFVNGIKSMIGAVGSAASSIAHTAIGAVKGMLGIGSPSKVFRTHGQAVVEGMILGLQDRAPALEAAMRAVAGGGLGGSHTTALTVAGIAGLAGSPSGPGGGTVINISAPITVNGYIGNEQELANVIYLRLQKTALEVDRRTPGTGNGLVLPGRAA